jgi:ketosteroid isomerase-like protein
MAMRNLLYLTISALLLLASCQESGPKLPPSPEPILTADRAFSKASLENGWVDAFLEFAEDSAVLLRPNAPPIEGKLFLIAYLSQYGDTVSQLSWEPKAGLMAVSGELGYTYGIWTMTQGDTLERKGTYVTVWRKNSEGQWKWVLDTGNDGLTDLTF